MFQHITTQQFASYAKRIERARMKANGSSTTYSGIARAAHSFIVENRGNLMIVREGWREAMKAAQ